MYKSSICMYKLVEKIFDIFTAPLFILDNKASVLFPPLSSQKYFKFVQCCGLLEEPEQTVESCQSAICTWKFHS